MIVDNDDYSITVRTEIDSDAQVVVNREFDTKEEIDNLINSYISDNYKVSNCDIIETDTKYIISTTFDKEVYYVDTTSIGDNLLGLGSSITTSPTVNYSFTSSASASCKLEASTANAVKETGIIEDGSHSNQDFSAVNKEFAYYPFKTEEIQIYPLSQKPVYSEDMQKVYCTECGRKLQAKYKFCPFCGTQV